MRKYFACMLLAATSLLLSYCGTSKKAAAKAEPAKTTYAANVSAIIMGSCSPCHVPSKGGNKKAYDNFENTKTDIDEIIRRIELNPGDRGYMPFKNAKLSDSAIAVFKQWKADGMIQN
jgi:mono/diheme cytochrome c family protein